MATQIFTSFDTDEFKALLSECVAEAVKTELQAIITTEPSNSILTRNQAAELLDISLPTLHDYNKRGIIKAYRLGTKVRYKQEDIHAALKEINYGRRKI